MSNCLVTKLKGVIDNPNLPYFGETVFNGNLTKRNGNEYYYSIGTVNTGDVFIVTLKANFAIEASQQLSLYLKGSSVISNVIDLRGENLLSEKTYMLTATSGDNATLEIYSGQSFNEVAFTVKILKKY